MLEKKGNKQNKLGKILVYQTGIRIEFERITSLNSEF